MKVVGSLLILLLVAYLLPINNAAAQIDISIKTKKRITLLLIKNNSEQPIYEFKIHSDDIRFIKVRGWKSIKIDTTITLNTDNKPLTKGKSMPLLIIGEGALELKAFGSDKELISSLTLMLPEICSGSAACFTAIVTKIIDGDTLDVNNGTRIRLALTNTPEKGERNYKEAKQLTATLCPVGSSVLIDEDDGQREGSHGRMIAKVFCNNKILNAELLYAGVATIYTLFCNKSEFADESWAKQYGC